MSYLNEINRRKPSHCAESHSDDRGRLVVFLKARELNGPQKKFGQIYFVTFNRRGVIRGNHYHKKWREWAGIVFGRIKVVLKDMNTGKRRELVLNADSKRYVRLELAPNTAHAFKSLSSRAILLNYGDTEWPKADSFFHQILK